MPPARMSRDAAERWNLTPAKLQWLAAGRREADFAARLSAFAIIDGYRPTRGVATTRLGIHHENTKLHIGKRPVLHTSVPRVGTPHMVILVSR
jgi:hypothetical protein